MSMSMCVHLEMMCRSMSAIAHGLEDVINDDNAYGYSELALSGFLRIVTNRRIFDVATPIDEALAFTDVIMNQPNAIRVQPSARHWSIFKSLCREVAAAGGLVTNTYFAALAIESGCEWITADRDFAQFEGVEVAASV